MLQALQRLLPSWLSGPKPEPQPFKSTEIPPQPASTLHDHSVTPRPPTLFNRVGTDVVDGGAVRLNVELAKKPEYRDSAFAALRSFNCAPEHLPPELRSAYEAYLAEHPQE